VPGARQPEAQPAPRQLPAPRLHQAQNLPPLRAQRPADTDLVRVPAHSVGQHTVEPDGRELEWDPGKDRQQDRGEALDGMDSATNSSMHRNLDGS